MSSSSSAPHPPADPSSRDDFWTKPEIIHDCIEWTKKVVFPQLNGRHLFFLDSSAGSNQAAMDLGVPYYSLDLFAGTYPTQYGRVVRQDWFRTRAVDVPVDRRNTDLAIGFNPPYAQRFRLIHQFVDHAVREFQPEWFFWVLPKNFKMQPEHSAMYDLVFTKKLDWHAFYRPFSQTDQGGVLTEYRIYRRRSSPKSMDELNHEREVVVYPPHPEVDLMKLEEFYGTPLGQAVLNGTDPRAALRVMIVRNWGRAAVREVLLPQMDGSLANFKDMGGEPRYVYRTWKDFQEAMSPACFTVLVFKDVGVGAPPGQGQGVPGGGALPGGGIPPGGAGQRRHLAQAAAMGDPRPREAFRQDWIAAWFKMSEHAFDGRNTVMITFTRRKCWELIWRVFGGEGREPGQAPRQQQRGQAGVPQGGGVPRPIAAPPRPGQGRLAPPLPPIPGGPRGG